MSIRYPAPLQAGSLAEVTLTDTTATITQSLI
jgi:hypothetical protein